MSCTKTNQVGREHAQIPATVLETTICTAISAAAAEWNFKNEKEGSHVGHCRLIAWTLSASKRNWIETHNGFASKAIVEKYGGANILVWQQCAAAPLRDGHMHSNIELLGCIFALTVRQCTCTPGRSGVHSCALQRRLFVKNCPMRTLTIYHIILICFRRSGRPHDVLDTYCCRLWGWSQ